MSHVVFLTALIVCVFGTSAIAEEKIMEKQVLKLSDIQLMSRTGSTLIITSDEEMEKLEKDPGMKVKAFDSSFAEMAKQMEGHDGAVLNVAYDFFFGGDKREYFPTSQQCIRTFKALHDIARSHGLGFGASVMNPLDLGPAYYRQKKRGGQHYQFQEGLLKPDGSFEVTVKVQRQWFHNKGPVNLYVKGVRAFAFSESRIGDTSYYVVDPAKILNISDAAKLSYDEKEAGPEVNGVVSGKASGIGDRDRVLAVVVYDVEDMDYFHEDALPFIKGMLDAHKAAGITYDSFYSDEMHIQFDWDLGRHFGETEIDTRYITPGLISKYAQLHGKQYEDFEKYLVYFAFAQHGFLNQDKEPEMAQHVFGSKKSDIYATWKFRRDYFRLLQDTVVDLFLEGKRYACEIFGKDRIWTRAHATWQESPTCDHVDAAWKPKDCPMSRYDYTPAYDWSSSIRESISGCCDYFRWGDYLSGNGNDFPEGGWIDRNYYGAAIAASFGVINEVPYSYWGHWGAPGPVSQRVHDVAAAYGLAGHMWNFGWVQNWQHRKAPVLALYPLDLNYVEERFGSWMVQYGYCDYLTAEKFVEMAQVLPNGNFKIKDREYSALVVLYQPMIPKYAMRKIRDLGERGGKVLWSGPPAAVYTEDGSSALMDWKETFGVDAVRDAWNGVGAENCIVSFASRLVQIPKFRIPTNLLVDRIYPASPAPGSQVAAMARVDGDMISIGTLRAGKRGMMVYFGGRPRDDQSGSTPDAPRTLYHLLRAMGVYTDEGTGWAEAASNNGDLLVCESPNGAVTITHHYYKVQENWGGGFFREKDEKFDESVLPPHRLNLTDQKFGPYTISYDGDRAVTFRTENDNLIAFGGTDTQGIKINGRDYRLTDVHANVTFAPLPKDQLAPGIKQGWIFVVSPAREVQGDLTVKVPFEIPSRAMWVSDAKGNGRGTPEKAALTIVNGQTELKIPTQRQGVNLYVYVEE